MRNDQHKSNSAFYQLLHVVTRPEPGLSMSSYIGSPFYKAL